MVIFHSYVSSPNGIQEFWNQHPQMSPRMSRSKSQGFYETTALIHDPLGQWTIQMQSSYCLKPALWQRSWRKGQKVSRHGARHGESLEQGASSRCRFRWLVVSSLSWFDIRFPKNRSIPKSSKSLAHCSIETRGDLGIPFTRMVKASRWRLFYRISWNVASPML